MSVSLYYSISQKTPFSAEERHALDSVMDEAYSAATVELETLGFWGDTSGPQTELQGSSKLIVDDPIEIMEWVAYLLNTLTQMRRLLPDADWQVHIDDLDVPWDDAEGYTLPGLDEL